MYQQYQANLLIICCSISLAGSLFTVFAYYLLKSYRNFALKLVMFLCIGDLIGALAILIYPPTLFKNVDPINSNEENYEFVDKTMCQFAGYLKLSGDMSTTCFGCIISTVLFLTVVKSKYNLHKKQWIILLLGYAAPFLYAIIPLLLKSINPDQYYCDILLNNKDQFQQNSDIKQEQEKIQLFMVYLPLWLGIIYMVAINSYVMWYMKKKINLSKEEIKNSIRVMYFPAILIICGFFMSLMFIFKYDMNLEEQEIVFTLQCIIGKLQGFFNALFYGFLPKVIVVIRQNICKKNQKIKQSNLQFTNVNNQSSKKKDIAKILMEEDMLQSQIGKQNNLDYRSKLSSEENISIFTDSYKQKMLQQQNNSLELNITDD